MSKASNKMEWSKPELMILNVSMSLGAGLCSSGNCNVEDWCRDGTGAISPGQGCGNGDLAGPCGCLTGTGVLPPPQGG